MSFLISYKDLSKSYGADILFSDISIGFSDGEKLGLIGANGTGKSTLLKIFANKEDADHGLRNERKHLNAVYLPQNEIFEVGKTAGEILDAYLDEYSATDTRLYSHAMKIIGQANFPALDKDIAEMSGGWKKRLSIVKALIQNPDLLFLDEPTNHLDIDGILWLEDLLARARFAFVLVTHDRYLLNSVSSAVMEIGKLFPGGFFKADGDYHNFLRRRSDCLDSQLKEEAALSNKVKRETQWLHRSPKARTTKAQFRVDNAERLSNELTEIKKRNRENTTAQFDFDTSGRQSRKLLEASKLTKTLGGKCLFSDLSFVLAPGTCIGLCGGNGTGKTTLMHILAGKMKPDSGMVRTIDGINIVYFDQEREQLDETMTLKKALSPDSDSVIYKNRPVHVVSWAKKFLFQPDQLEMPVSRLSGGEKARVIIANLMLIPADILILDEPTNDLDIPSLEILEAAISEFQGAVVISTHDRYMLDSVATSLIGFDGAGNVDFVQGINQWVSLVNERNTPTDKEAAMALPPKGKTDKQKVGFGKLTYKLAFELSQIENKILDAEQQEQDCKLLLEQKEIIENTDKLEQACLQLDTAQKNVASLYTRWEELESMKEK